MLSRLLHFALFIYSVVKAASVINSA